MSGDRNGRMSSDECLLSVAARFKVLKKYIGSPSVADKKIVNSCRSQSTLAGMDFPELGITPLARNSMYKYADLFSEKNPEFIGGYEGVGRSLLDELRRKVFSLEVRGGPYRSKSAYLMRSESKCENLESELVSIEAHSLRLSKAYLKLLGSMHELAVGNLNGDELRQRVRNLISDQNFLYGDLFVDIDRMREVRVEAINEK